MIGYVTLGTNELEKAVAFYDEFFKAMDIGRILEDDSYVAWGRLDGSAGLSLTKPYDGKPATVGNGVTVALAAGSNAMVDKLHAKALELGATDEGAVGYRDEMPGFYAGYFRDPDGHKLNVFHMEEPE